MLSYFTSQYWIAQIHTQVIYIYICICIHVISDYPKKLACHQMVGASKSVVWMHPAVTHGPHPPVLITGFELNSSQSPFHLQTNKHTNTQIPCNQTASVGCTVSAENPGMKPWFISCSFIGSISHYQILYGSIYVIDASASHFASDKYLVCWLHIRSSERGMWPSYDWNPVPRRRAIKYPVIKHSCGQWMTMAHL